MNFPTPRIIDATLDEAKIAGCDCVMLKHDGFPVTINCAAQACNVIAHWRHAKPDALFTCQLVEPLDALLVGAKNPRTPVIYLYDCWWMNGQDVQPLPYRNRYVLTRTNAKALDERFMIVQVYPIQAAPQLWREVIMDPVNLKGLVFRRSKDTAAGDLYVKRYYAETPEALS